MAKRSKRGNPLRTVWRGVKLIAQIPLILSATLRAYFCIVLGIRRKKESSKKEKIIIEE